MNPRLALLAALVTALPARADWPTLSATVGYASQVYLSRSWDLVDDNDHLPMGRIGAGVTFEMAAGLVDVEAAYQAGNTSQTLHTAGPAQLALQGFDVGASYRWPVLRYLHPYLHLGLGWDWATLTVYGDARLLQSVSNFAGSGMVGVQVPLVLNPKLKRSAVLLLDLGFGGVLRPGYAFDAMAPKPPDKKPEDPIAVRPTDLGTLPMSGLAYRLLVTVRY